MSAEKIGGATAEASPRRVTAPVAKSVALELPPISINRYHTEQITRDFVKPRTASEHLAVSPTKISRCVILHQHEIRRAATDGAVQFESTRHQIEKALESHDHFFRGHDEPLADENGDTRKYLSDWRHWYLYVRRMVTTYFIPLQLGVIAGLLWANIDYDSYVYLWGTSKTETMNLGFKIAGHYVTLKFILNDVFMMFFFGIAIVEIMVAVLPGGALSPIKKAVVPLMGTIGGIIGPILTFVALMFVQKAAGAFDDSPHEFSELMKGWGIVVATDISLAWLIASFVFGGGHSAIKFLLLLAVADDVGGMIIIAFFYPSPYPAEPIYLLLCVAGMVVAFGLRYFNVRHWAWYVFIGGPLAWYGLLQASVHASLALCFIVPFMPKYVEVKVKPAVNESGDAGEGKDAQSDVLIINEKRVVPGPLEQFDHDCAFFVHCGLFFFALANAGVQLNSNAFGYITLNVAVALMLGKTLGVFCLAAFAVKVLKCDLPDGMNLHHLFIVGVISGVGLTVALFVAESAYTQEDLLAQAKLGALLSIFSGVIAIIFGKVFKVVKVPAPTVSSGH